MELSALDFCKEAMQAAPAVAGGVATQPQDQQKPSSAKKWVKRGVGTAGTLGLAAAARKTYTGGGFGAAKKMWQGSKGLPGVGVGARVKETAKTLGQGFSKGHVFKAKS